MCISSSSLRRWTPALALAAVFLPASCGLLQKAASVPGAVLSPDEKPKFPPSLVQTGVMRFADTFAAQLQQATNDFAKEVGTPEGNVQAMTWFVGQSTAAFTIASGSNPHANLLDMIVLVTLGRMVHEEHWMGVWGEPDRHMLTMFQELEEEIWGVAAELLNDAQQAAVRRTFEDWRAANPDVAVTAFVRLPAFEDLLLTQEGEKEDVFSELSQLVSLDPLSGLEPTTREIEQTRLFAERTLFYLQRVPLILPTQAELFVLELTHLPAVEGALADSTRISEAAASLAQSSSELLEVVQVEREAAIKQISQELTLQRAGLVADLEEVQEPARQVLGDARLAFESGAEMSTAVEGALGALDRFVGRFHSPEPEPGTEPPPEPEPEPKVPAEPRRPFDITDYGDTAERLGVAAAEVARLVSTLEQSLPEARTLMDEATLRGERAIDHAFRRGVALGLILIGGAALALVIVRRFAPARPAAR
jgi:hypothetical protein